ncbi:hypothetical protein [Bdellovibrio sp. HCB337]|uniref:hypothetical protein n=1 Tax=Bdellovibrio sp. HCB337 TaxID=3394358 RepID=UPI0039A5DD4F
MSSVGGASDSKRQDDRVRKTREDYESREAENQKRQKAEMEHLNKKHYAEINRITADFDREMDELKSHYRQNLNERDQSNIRKVDEVRNLYKEQLRKKTEENDGDRRQMRNAFNGAIQKQKSISEMQKDNLIENHQSEINQQGEKFQEMSLRNRQELKESLGDHDQKLKDAHGREMNATIKDRDTQLGNKDRDNKELRKAYEGKLNAERRQREAESSRWNQKYKDTVANNNEEKTDTMRTQGFVLRGELDELNRKYNNAINKKYEQLDDANQELRDSVNDRLNGQVRSKQSQIERLSSKLNHEMINNERLRNIERRDLQSKHVEQVDLLERQKEGAVENMKALNNKRIGEMVDHTNKSLRNSNRDHKSEMDLTTQRNRQDREMLVQQQKDAVEQISGTAESRVKKITKLSRDNQEAYSKYFDSSLDQMKDNYSERITEQRDRNTDDMVRLNKAMSDRFRGMEKNYGQRMEALTSTYESKINQMNENHQKELKRIESYYAQRMNNKDKEVKQSQGSLEMKYEAKIAQMNEAHQDQLDRMSRRHQEDMQNLSTRMSNYSKKA